MERGVGGWKVLNVCRRERGDYQNRKSAEEGGGVQILVIFWERNNIMPPYVTLK